MTTSPFGELPWRPDDRGLVCAVAQQRGTGEVLMVAWMDEEALRRTIATGRATYWSRSRGEYWVKGETSGNAQFVHSISVDCDGDALLLEVDQTGPACHTGSRSCFRPAAVPAGAGSAQGHGATTGRTATADVSDSTSEQGEAR